MRNTSMQLCLLCQLSAHTRLGSTAATVLPSAKVSAARHTMFAGTNGIARQGAHRGAAAGQAAAAHGAPLDAGAEAAALAEAHHRVHKRLQVGPIRPAAPACAHAGCSSTRRAWPYCSLNRQDAPSQAARYGTRSGRLRASSHSSASPATCVGAVAPPAAAARSCSTEASRPVQDPVQSAPCSCSLYIVWYVERMLRSMMTLSSSNAHCCLLVAHGA